MNVLFVREESHWLVDMYRGFGVLSQLRRIIPDLNIIEPVHSVNNQEDIWKDVIQADVAYFLRTDTPLNREIARTCKIMGVPIWYDIDDDLFNLAPDSNAHRYYSMPEVQKSLAWFLTIADKVTVSTHHLKRIFSKYRPEKGMTLDTMIPVIPNALDTYVFKDVVQYPEAVPLKRVTWRGGTTHKDDLRAFTDEFIDFNARTHDWELHFWGDDPYWISRIGETEGTRPRIIYSPNVRKFYEYMNVLRNKVRAFAIVVPLRKNKFNDAKSNIAAIEATYAGAVPIVPDWEEWKPFEGALFYSDKETFRKALESVIEMSDEERKDRWEKNLKVVMEQYALHIVNVQRATILNQLATRENLNAR
jgi:hypothetical protein